MSKVIWCGTWLFSVLVLPHTLQAQAIFQTIALSGTTAPGTGGQSFATFDPGTTTPTFSAPTINNAGTVAFLSYLSGGMNGNQGLFSTLGGNLFPVAQTGQGASPGGIGVYSTFQQGNSLLLPVSLSQSGLVSTAAFTLAGPPINEAFQVASRGAGGLSSVAVTGSLIPGGGGAEYTSITGNSGMLAPQLNAQGHMLFGAGGDDGQV